MLEANTNNCDVCTCIYFVKCSNLCYAYIFIGRGTGGIVPPPGPLEKILASYTPGPPPPPPSL